MKSWDSIQPKDQWLWIVRAELAKKSAGKSILAEHAGKHLSALLTAHQRTHGKQFPARALDGSAGSYFQYHYKEILLHIPLKDWGRVLSSIIVDRSPFSNVEFRNLGELAFLWSKFRGESRRERLEAIEPFVRFLTKTIGLVYRKPIVLGNVRMHAVGLSVASLNLPQIIPIIMTFVGGSRGATKVAFEYTIDLQGTLQSMGDVGRELILNIVVSPPEKISGYARLMKSESNFLLLYERDIKSIFLSERYVDGVKEWIQRSLGLARLNPYTTEKPVDRPEMFFGRAEEIRMILENPAKDFMVVGSRRIGKSSLLRYLKDTVENSGSRVPIFLDCSGIDSGQEFAVRLTYLINPRRVKRITLPTLAQMVRANKSAAKKRFLLLLDETDKLVDLALKSNDWAIFEVLRELSNEQLIQAVFAGYKTLYKAWKNLESPLFNFVSPVYLATLNVQSARHLATRPVNALKVSYRSGKLVNQIVSETGGHPSFLQFFCSELIKLIDGEGERVITATHVNSIRQLKIYREFVLKPFQAEGNLSALERLILLNLVKLKEHEFATDVVLKVLNTGSSMVTTRAALESLQNLEIAGFILVKELSEGAGSTQSGTVYVWTVPGFPIIVERTLPVDREIGELEAEVGIAKEE